MNEEKKHNIPLELLTKYFAGETSDLENTEVQRWVDADFINKMEFDAIQKLWNHTKNTQNSQFVDIDTEWQNFSKSLHIKSPLRFPRVNLYKVLIVLCFLFILSFFGYYKTNKISLKNETTQSLPDFELPDGSSVSLNKNSKIIFNKNFGKKNRFVILKGEAFFTIKKNSKLPFILKAEKTRAEVVGTEFNISAYPNSDEITITVNEGKVRFYENRKPTIQKILYSGETGIYNKKSHTIKKAGININNSKFRETDKFY